MEWVCCVWFAQDPVGMQEILDNADVHSLNQERFKLPTRTIAKIFLFRLIYGGSAWSYVYDPEFNWVSNKVSFWQKVIDEFYEKYKGVAALHKRWVNEVITTGGLVMPTGRMYKFTPYSKNGELKWPVTQIVNYPVQGLGHDLVTISRVSLFRRCFHFSNRSFKLLSTVHDSIVLDSTSEILPKIIPIVDDVFNFIPSNFWNLFGVEFNLPTRYEISIGPNMKDLEVLK